MTVQSAHIVFLAYDDMKVVAEIPKDKSEAEAQSIATQIHDAGMGRYDRHYDRYSRHDYDLVGYWRKELGRAGFNVLLCEYPDI